MDSEQAMWAKQWIKDHCNLTRFQTGYTYLFEIISQNNTVIVNYLFEGLVLLAITDESGHELPYDDVLHSARTIGFFMVTPRIAAPYSEILWYCAGIDLNMQESTTPNRPPFVSGALPVKKQQEGWVVKFKDGRRQKIVYSWWKEVRQVTNLVHPQIVWLLVRLDKIKEILGNLPNHFRVEINRIIRALGRKFIETVKHVEEHLIMLRMKSRNVAGETGGKMYGVWDDAFDLLVSDQSEDSEDSTSEEGSFKLREQSEKLCLDDNNIIASDLTRQDCDDKHIEEGTVTTDFVKLARKLDRYFDVSAFPISWYEDVNRSPVYNQRNENFLRLPVLDYICPTSPALDGYEPSDNFKQTWCKGWKTLPINQMQFIQEVLQKNHLHPRFLQLPVEVIFLVLDFLDGQSLAIMSQVCMQLRYIVKSSHVLRKRISSIANPEEVDKLDMTTTGTTTRNAVEYYDYYDDYDDYDDDYSPRYSPAESWDGYGSY
ncbi:2 -5 RNA ligase [Paramuricea clavata]|uniref:2 -5 RNA ligase n=1 Tax=Paramuricea clavata TaxID=317549 RepID=A0A7D9J1D8_PARCT|nr:2 -5 RNA ligase [Paramuricea clavata]